MKANRRPSPPNRAPAAPEPGEQQIQREAYALWLERGRPSGGELDIWLAAKERLRHRLRPPAGWGDPSCPHPLHFPPSHEAQRHPVPDTRN